MAKQFHSDVFDNGLSEVVTACDKMVLCKAAPTTFAEANSDDGSGGSKVAEVAMASGDFTLQDKTGGGREVVVAAKAGVTAADDTLGTDDLHIALLDTVGSRLLVVTDETTDQPITAGNPINFPSWAFGHSDPV